MLGIIVWREDWGRQISWRAGKSVELAGPIEYVAVGGDQLVAFLGSSNDDAVGRVVVKIGQRHRAGGYCAVNRNLHEPCVQRGFGAICIAVHV